MQIYQQRAERPNLDRLVDRILFDAHIGDGEQATIRSLWRTTEHENANTVLDSMCGPRLITSGWAGWLRYGDRGRRQIFLFLMPGDFIVPGLFQLECCDLVALTPLRTVDATVLVQGAATLTPHSDALIADSSRYYRLLLLDHLTRLTAGCTTRGVAHLLTELHARSLRSGACTDGRFSLPIGQRVLASALGRSTVQVNKIINRFQADGLLAVGYDWMELRDPDRLRALAGMTHSVLYPARPDVTLQSQIETSVAA